MQLLVTSSHILLNFSATWLYNGHSTTTPLQCNSDDNDNISHRGFGGLQYSVQPSLLIVVCTTFHLETSNFGAMFFSRQTEKKIGCALFSVVFR